MFSPRFLCRCRLRRRRSLGEERCPSLYRTGVLCWRYISNLCLRLRRKRKLPN